MSFRKFVAVAAFTLAAAGLFAAAPAEANQPKKVRAPFALSQIDRNGDRNISAREWDWAEKRGYDRVSKQGGHVTRRTYQAYVNRYYTYVDWRDDHHDNHGNGHGVFGSYSPWDLGHR
jgi:hypothetical protein